MSAVQTKFYNLFWANPACRRIFSVHKEQLLEKKEIEISNEKRVFYLQKLVLSNNQKQKIKSEIIASRIGNRGVDLTDQLSVNTTKYFDEAKFQAQVDKYFGKAIEKITSKLNSGTFSQVKFGFELLNSLSSEEKLISFLKKYHLISDNIQSFEQIEDILNKKISTLITKETILDFIDSIDNMSEVYTNMVYTSLFESNNFYLDVLYDDEKFSDRQSLFDLLYESKVIESGIYKTYYECYHCDSGSFKAIATIKSKPSKVGLKCPLCNKETFYLSPFKINDEIFNHITDKDGILKPAIQHLLLLKGFTFKENFVMPPDIELDLVGFGKNDFSAIFEIKMYKTNTPLSTQKSNLNTAISKTANMKRKVLIADDGFKNSYSILITNYSDKETLNIVRNENKSLLKDHRIKLFCLDELKEFIENLD